MKKILIVLFFFSYGLKAQISINKEYSSTALSFFNVIEDAQSYSLGGGVSIEPRDNNICQNISKSVFMDKKLSFSFSYRAWMRNFIKDMNFTHLSSAYLIDDYSAFVFSYTHLNLGKIDKYSNTKAYLGNIEAYESLLNISYSRKISKSSSLGLSVKYISSNIDPIIKKSALAADISFYYTSRLFNGKLSGGFLLSNIGGKVNYEGDKYFLPLTSKFAISYKYILDDNNVLNISSEVSKLMISNEDKYYSDDGVRNNMIVGIQKDETVLESFLKSMNENTLSSFSLGVEYIYASTIFGRCGIKTYNNEDKLILLGLGIEKYSVNIDLAYSFYINQRSQLNDNLFVTLSFNI